MNKIKEILRTEKGVLALTSTLASIAVIIGILIMGSRGNLEVQQQAILIVAIVVGVLTVNIGKKVIKGLTLGLISLYMISLYTVIAMANTGHIIEPFMLSVAAVLLFLAQSYDKYQLGALRSKYIWGSLYIFILVIVKSAIIITTKEILLAESVGALTIALYLTLWRMWAMSGKTRVIAPHIIDEYEVDGIQIVEISDDLIENKWSGVDNAIPYITVRSLNEADEKKRLVFFKRSHSEIFLELNHGKKSLYIKADDIDYHMEQIKELLND